MVKNLLSGQLGPIKSTAPPKGHTVLSGEDPAMSHQSQVERSNVNQSTNYRSGSGAVGIFEAMSPHSIQSRQRGATIDNDKSIISQHSPNRSSKGNSPT